MKICRDYFHHHCFFYTFEAMIRAHTSTASITPGNVSGRKMPIFCTAKLSPVLGLTSFVSERQVYKKLLDLMPKGKMIPTNIFQQEFMHYPRQQQCAIDCLEQMEVNGGSIVKCYKFT